MVQTYKKVLLLIAIIGVTILNEGCNKIFFHPFRRDKSGLQPTSEHFRSFQVKKSETPKKKPLNSAERRINRKAEKNKREELKGQEAARKRHISNQTPKVQERMKKSFVESEQTRKRKTFWERLMFWNRGKSKEKRLK
ncbi:MAG: hypothetical protein EHM93_09070 [Bacteroidales bacterium]|nr:MAG: hypothetical protein EHM93_09070 [Bacteroidales bacterium]